MPAVAPQSKVLVTGASGFIAAWVVKTLLERGFYVRGTVRSSAKGEYLANMFKAHADRFEYVIVEDIAKDGAFDEAVKGVAAVEHTASPFHFKAEDPDELIVPAVNGTVGVLKSISKFGSSVQRVVVTSSVAAILRPVEHQTTLSEKDWNEFSAQEAKIKGKDATNIHKYRASKTLAERAAWDFVAKNKSEINWDLAVLNPPMVWGPTIHDIPNASSLNTSLLEIYAMIKGQKDIASTPGGNWVDVRDVATAHVNAIVTEAAGGERFIVASGPYTNQGIIDAVHDGTASDAVLAALPKGTPGAGNNAVHPVLLDTTKARTVLGMKFRQLSETAQDTARSLLANEKVFGW
ncbi:hypothetical protein JB92DRAFT_3108057 [Gautieria morchelliformis]|nr:hypothetical protein JB92DRAFT_3108057 [Gautieria morchelliformis]